MAGGHCFSLLCLETCNFPAVIFQAAHLSSRAGHLLIPFSQCFGEIWVHSSEFTSFCQADNSVSTRACSLYLVRRNCRAESASQTTRWLMCIAAGLLTGLHFSLQSSRELHNYFMLPFGHLCLKFWSVSLDFVRTRWDVSWGFLPSPGMCNTLGVPRVGKHFPLLFVRRTL